MEREKIELTTGQLRDLVQESYYTHDEIEIEFKEIKREITGTSRHGNYNELVTQRISDTKYFVVRYEDSVKETCEFEDMNMNGATLTEVFPVTRTITVYE